MSEHTPHDAPSVGKQVFNIIALLVLPLFIVASLVSVYRSADQGTPGAMTEEAIMSRIQKVGAIQLGSASREPKTGEAVYKAQCGTCHGAGMLGAPKFQDAAAWAPRIAQGYDALLNSALKGKGNMTPQGGGAFSDFEVGRAVVYMANAAGGKLAEPKAPDQGSAQTATK
ncbi:MAG: hypothetical protein OHK0048_01970 [Rhodoferax sp.]